MEHNELKPCPFCGGEAEKTLIGNAFTKSRRVIIKCTKCFVEQKTGTIYHNHVWLEEIATANWNKRVDSKPVEIPEITDERFKMPTDKQLVGIALLFNDGVLDETKLADMIGMSEFIINRLYENGDCSVPSSKE